MLQDRGTWGASVTAALIAVLLLGLAANRDAAFSVTKARQANSTPPSTAFPKTLTPEPALILRLQKFFSDAFDHPVNLAVLLQQMINESAVAELPGVGYILYNPAHMLFLHLPEEWRGEAQIRVATMEDVFKVLEVEWPANPSMAAYGVGFEEFALLSELMQVSDTREALGEVWSTSLASNEHRERMRYLLLRPVEQTSTIGSQAPDCQREMNKFVNDVRAGKRNAIPSLPGFTNFVKPTRFIRQDSQIFLVLSETVTARYYVLAQFDVSKNSCTISWERSLFAL